YHGAPIPAGGCVGEAREALDENGPGSDFTLVGTLNTQSFEQSQQVPAVRDTIAAWSRCMSAAGHPYADPLAAADAFDAATPSPGPEEIATAEADVDCKTRTHLVNVWRTAETTLQQAAVQ